MNKLNLTVVLLPVLALTACGKKSNEAQVADSVGQSVNGALTALAGPLDDGAGESQAPMAASNDLPKQTMFAKILEETLLPKTAYAALSCSRSLTGSAGSCSREVNCSYGPYSWSGSVALTFSNGASCLNPFIPNAGDFFTRQANFSRSAYRWTWQTLSDAHENYLGDSISGGAKVTRQASLDLGIDVLGVSKVLSRGSSTIADMSFRTSEPIIVNHLPRLGRIVRSGKMTIDHNRLKYTAVHTYKDITWTDVSCPYPTSGTIDIAFSGSEDGTASVTFNGCGSFLITRNGEQASDTMEGAE